VNNEFIKIPHAKFSNLIIRDNVGKFERTISLINELSSLKIDNLILYNTDHGGFIPINCSQNYKNIYLVETNTIHIDNILLNNAKNKYNL
jgi:hypothetical protein